MSADRPCSLCAHVARMRTAEPYCRLSAAFYTCAEERSMSWIQAIAYNACGRSGRFFLPIVSRVQPPDRGWAGRSTSDADVR